MRRTTVHSIALLLSLALAPLVLTTQVSAQGPDITVSNTGAVAKNGTVGNITAYSIATTSCNRANVVAIWIDPTQNPVIGGNIYRVSGDGLLEHLGMSWLKHGFCAVNEGSCGTCQGTDCDTLGIGCADTYGTGLNGSQGNLGPKSEVNATDGTFIPLSDNSTGNAIYKRIQVQNDDLNPALNPGASYFSVAQYITVDEAAWDNMFNNNSWRELSVGGLSGGGYNLSYTGGTVEAEDPILAWQNFTTGVSREELLTSEAGTADGQVIVGSRVVDLGGGVYRYQYAIFNNNSDRSIHSLSIPIPAGLPLSNVYFRDVDCHSGEPYDNTDWTSTQNASSIRWNGGTFASNNDANAIRWGTTYSFSFDAAAAPVPVTGTMEYFKPGTPSTLTFNTQGPSSSFVLPVTGLTCTPSFDMTQLSWSNGASYSSIEVTRDGLSIATLGGGATSYTDLNPAIGSHTYGVNGLSGATQSGPVTCSITTPPPPPLAFDFIAETMSASYDQGNGIGSFSAAISVLEDSNNVVYPNNIRGLSMSLSNDSNLVLPSGATESALLAAMNGGSGPEFFAPGVYSNAFTLGVYFSFSGDEAIVATSAMEIVSVQYDTNAATLAGNSAGTSTALTWQSGMGNVPVPNTVLLDNSDEADPSFVNGTVTLVAAAGEPRFVRGDCNQDSSIDISDPVNLLQGLFTGGTILCADACDANDDAVLGLPDALQILGYLFQGSAPFAAPFPSCGEDGAADALDCASPVCL